MSDMETFIVNDSVEANGRSGISKTDQAFHYITTQILERRIMPGQRLVERGLARELSMSKTPVREALLKLKDVGLATGDFQNGVYVVSFTGQDALELVDLREMLEGLSARRAVASTDQESLEELERLLDKSQNAMEEGDTHAYSELDQDFHTSLIQLGGSRRLHEIYSRLRLQTKFLMRSTMRLPDRGMEISWVEHRAVLDALKSGDEDRCEATARQHIHNTRDALEKWLREGYML
jgi:DNA-binding GntR family transcriptional regulator